MQNPWILFAEHEVVDFTQEMELGGLPGAAKQLDGFFGGGHGVGIWGTLQLSSPYGGGPPT